MKAGLGDMPFKIDRQGAKDAKDTRLNCNFLGALRALGALAVKSLPIDSR